VGAELGPIAYAAVSESPRTLETAIAMGVAVDDILPLGAGYSTSEVAHHDQWTWTTPNVRYRELIARGGPFADASARELGLWRAAVDHVSDGDVALVVSHGGSIEPTVVTALPDVEVDDWGAPFSHLDGVRLVFDNGSFDLVEFHRYRRRAAA
jgi:broad specificity phosphatase PhoE